MNECKRHYYKVRYHVIWDDANFFASDDYEKALQEAKSLKTRHPFDDIRLRKKINEEIDEKITIWTL